MGLEAGKSIKLESNNQYGYFFRITKKVSCITLLTGCSFALFDQNHINPLTPTGPSLTSKIVWRYMLGVCGLKIVI